MQRGLEMTEKDIEMLINNAVKMRKRAYVRYSGYSVGAALITKNGKIYTGCNIENASFTPTVCAERTAFFKAISEGEKGFKAIAIAAGPAGQKCTDYPSPCGVCRQVMMEFCNPDKFLVFLAKNEKDYLVYTLSELLPLGFGPDSLSTSSKTISK